MPELPEVEIVTRGLAPAFEGATFADVRLNRADLRFPFDENFAERLTGGRVMRLYRRAKYIIAEVQSGLALAMHLGMTGRFTIMPACEMGQTFTPGEFYYDYDADPRHDHVIFTMSVRHSDRLRLSRDGYAETGLPLDVTQEPALPVSGVHLPVERWIPDNACGVSGMTLRLLGASEMTLGESGGSGVTSAVHDPREDTVVRYNDVRRFGFMTLFQAGEMAAHPLFRHLGVEPLSDALTPDYLAAKAKGKTTPLKAFLMDQRVVAGLGNIYVCEAMFRAGLPPNAEAGAVTRGRHSAARARTLTASIKAVLNDALEAGGSSLRDYRHANGGTGSFQDNFHVYGRAGEPCHNACGSTIERLVQQGRSTFYCPRCQGKL